MNSLLDTVMHIQQQCSDPKQKKKKEEEEKNFDDFTKLRKKIAKDIKDTRTQIQERNELLGKTDANASTVRMSSNIRAKLKTIQKDAEQLSALQARDQAKVDKKKLKKKPIDPRIEQEVENRATIVQLCFDHIEECKKLEKSGGKGGDNFSSSNKEHEQPLITELPDIDGDEGFQLLRRNDQEIDKKLDQVGEGVAVLKDMAVEMGREIEMQSMVLTELDKKVDTTQAHLNNLNRRLKKTLTSVRKADRFIIDFILLIIVLAIAGYIYNLLT